jgi:hypothetical protein
MDTKNSTKKQIPTESNPNDKVNKFIDKTGVYIRKSKEYYDHVKNVIKETPLQIKILNITVPLALTYIFTIMFYNLAFSIIFSLLTFGVIALMSFPIAIGYMILYIIVISTQSSERLSILGTPIKETDIRKNKTPFDCANKSLIIKSNTLPKTLNKNYFSYTFWIYINNQTSSDKNYNTWNNFRYNEWKSVFYRGDAITANNLNILNQYPGVWLTPILNNMVVVFQNGSTVERLEITNVPFNKWVNYAIVVEKSAVSIYIDGLLDRTLNLSNSVAISEGNIYISGDKEISFATSVDSKKSGFAGSLAQLIYYNNALTPSDVYQSYEYYKRIVDDYQNKIKFKNTYKYDTSNLITNSDVYTIRT